MSEKKNLKEEELKKVAGGAEVRHLLSTSGAVAERQIDFSGGDFSPSTAKVMVQSTGSATGTGFFQKLLHFFRKKTAKNTVSGKEAVVLSSSGDKQYFA